MLSLQDHRLDLRVEGGHGPVSERKWRHRLAVQVNPDQTYDVVADGVINY